jgi:hypothetical protein
MGFLNRLVKGRNVCWHRRECRYYTESSYTCNTGEKDYCGVYRRWDTDSKRMIKESPRNV